MALPNKVWEGYGEVGPSELSDCTPCLPLIDYGKTVEGWLDESKDSSRVPFSDI